MFCPNCGTKCEDTHRYCYKCGFALPVIPSGDPVVKEDVPEIPAIEPLIPEEASVPFPETANLINAYVETDMPESDAESEAATEPAPEVTTPKKGKLWPAIAAMAVLVVIGLTAFLFGSGGSASSTPWFTVENGTLYFNEALYVGSKELTIPSKVDGQIVTAIGSNAFRGCDNLVTVIIPDTVTSIGDSAFAGCTALRGIYIPKTVLTVGDRAFQNCTAMEAIYAFSALESIGDNALDGCTSLRYIIFDGTYSQWLALYDGKFVGNVELHANDGTYYSKP